MVKGKDYIVPYGNTDDLKTILIALSGQLKQEKLFATSLLAPRH
jgi:hypothetical protein